MALMTRNPWQLLDMLNQEMSRRYEPDLDDDTRVVGSNWSPAVDIREETGRYVLHADIPGVRPEDIEITMEKGVLTIRGERKHDAQESEEGYHRIERAHGTFMRRFSLPDNVDAEKISATSKDGVIEILLPKAGSTEPKRIQIKE